MKTIPWKPNDRARVTFCTLSDCRQFDIVKVYWDPADLQARLAELSFDIRIRRVGETFMYGVGRAAGP